MTVKENLIRLIIEMDESTVRTIEEYVNDLLWEQIPEEKPTDEERAILEKFHSGDETYASCYDLSDVLSDRI